MASEINLSCPFVSQSFFFPEVRLHKYVTHDLSLGILAGVPRGRVGSEHVDRSSNGQVPTKHSNQQPMGKTHIYPLDSEASVQAPVNGD